MPLVGSEDVGDREAAVAQRHHDLFRLGLLHARIIGALRHEQRRLDLLRGIERRLTLELGFALGRLRIAHAFVEADAARLPVRRNRVEQCDEVRGAHDRNRSRIKIGRERDTRECRVTAVRAAHDANALWVGDSLRHQMLHAPGDVVLHLVAPLLVPCVQELLAVAGGGPEVRHQHGVAAVREELREVVEAPAITSPRTAVRHHDERQRLGSHTLRQSQERRDLETVR